MIGTQNLSTTSKKYPRALSSAPTFKYEEAGKRPPATQKRNLMGCVQTKLSSDELTLLEWVAISFSIGSARPRNQTSISCTAGRFFTTESSGKQHPPLGSA